MGDSTMSANIHPSDRCKEFFNRVKMGKLLYCLAKINKTDDNETIEVFYCHGKDNTNDIDGWTCDDEKNHNVKKKHGKKPKRSQGEFESAVWEPFCQVVERELLETGGWAMINVEYKDKNGAWNDKSVQIMFSDIVHWISKGSFYLVLAITTSLVFLVDLKISRSTPSVICKILKRSAKKC